MKRTLNYVFTGMMESFSDCSRLDYTRETIAKTNKLAREEYKNAMRLYELGYRDEKPQKPRIFRVRLMARGPRKEAALRDGKRARAYDQYLPIRHGKWFDVYIHRVYEWDFAK